MKTKFKLVISILLGFTLLNACSGDKKEQKTTPETQSSPATEKIVSSKPVDPMSNKGIGPISSVELGELDDTKAEEGKQLFTDKCSACHKIDKKYIGPKMSGILERRTPEWTMNMILNTEQMVAEDPIAMDLLKEFLSPMANQNLTEEETRAIIEYFRTI